MKKEYKVADLIILIVLCVVLVVNLIDVLSYIKIDTDIPLITAGAEKLYDLIWSYHPHDDYFDDPSFVRTSSRLAELFGRNLFFGFSINKAVFVITSAGALALGVLRYKAKMLKLQNIIFYAAVSTVLFFIAFVVSDAIYAQWDKAGVDSYWT